MLVSGKQKSDLYVCVCVCVCVHTRILFQMLFYHNIWLWFRKKLSDWRSLEKYIDSVCVSCSVVSDSLWPRGLYGKNTGVGGLLCAWDPPGSSVHGILQARTLEWVAMPSSRGSSPPKDQTSVSHIEGRFFTTEPQGSLCRLQLLGAGKVGGSW